jgi:hypothetical protein
VTHSKESKEICMVVDSLPPEDRKYIRDMVFRVAAVARDPKNESTLRKKLRKVSLGAFSWAVIAIASVSAATPTEVPSATEIFGVELVNGIGADDDGSKHNGAGYGYDDKKEIPHIHLHRDSVNSLTQH